MDGSHPGDRRVFSGYDRATKARVAIKKLLLPVDCQLPPTVTREIKILKQLRHYNIVKLIDVVTSKCTRFEGETGVALVGWLVGLVLYQCLVVVAWRRFIYDLTDHHRCTTPFHHPSMN